MGIRVRLFSALTVVVLGGAGLAACAQQTAAPEPALQPVLVELFTSEGCSSCPPADELLGKLEGKRTDTGLLIVALSEHVTYWNHDGWTDPFSDEDYTQRQTRYAEQFHLDSPYTPQVVINGEHQMLGSDARAILEALKAQKAKADNSLHILKAVAVPGAVEVTFSVTGTLPKGSASVFAVVADDTDTSTVERGENKGKTITHVAVARSLTRLGGFKVGEPKTVKLHAPKRVGAAAKGGQHVVLFAQIDGEGSVLSVASAEVAVESPQTAGLAQVH
jgi:hypothetical protein